MPEFAIAEVGTSELAMTVAFYGKSSSWQKFAMSAAMPPLAGALILALVFYRA